MEDKEKKAKDGITFLKEWYEIIRHLPVEEKGIIFTAIFEKCLGKEMEIENPQLKAIYLLIATQINHMAERNQKYRDAQIKSKEANKNNAQQTDNLLPSNKQPKDEQSHSKAIAKVGQSIGNDEAKVEQSLLYNINIKENKNKINEKEIKENIKERWNAFAKHSSLPLIKVFSKKRQDSLAVRIKEWQKTANEQGLYDIMEVFDRILDMIKAQPFLTGNNSHGWQINFDWLIENSNNWVKVYEGAYMDAQKPVEVMTKPVKQSDIDRQMVAEMYKGGNW